MPDIPPNAPDVALSSANSDDGTRDTLEFELLEAERALRKLLTREAGQRYWLRWIAVGTGGLVIIGMAAALWILASRLFWGPIVVGSPAFSVAIIAAPIISITAITVALFVGAFRKFDDKDLETMGNGLSGTTKLMRGF